jgi:hypothetical protein
MLGRARADVVHRTLTLMWQWSPMVRSIHRDARDTHHTVSASILESVGKGFLIATATVVAGIMFGTAHLAAIGLWMLGVAATSGVGCMIGSAIVRNLGCDRCEMKVGGTPRATNVRKDLGAMPVVEEAGDVAPEKRWARRIVMTGQHCENATGRGV